MVFNNKMGGGDGGHEQGAALVPWKGEELWLQDDHGP